MNQETPAPKKVLFLITKATWGGAGRYVFDLATMLPKDAWAPELACGELGRLSAALQERGVPVHDIEAMGRDVSPVADSKSFVAILQLVRQARPDVLHINSSKAAAFGALAGFLCNTPRIIFTAHGWPFKENRNVLATWLIYQITWLTVFLSHATIVVSKQDLKIGRRMPLVGRKIHYVPLGITPPAMLSRSDAWARILEMVPIENPLLPRVVSIAELTKNKGLRYGIDAIAALKNRNIACNLFLIGDGELRQELETYAIEKEVETRVYFLGFVEDASRLLTAFDLFLLPSIKEGMPYVLIEAAHAGMPIVATDAIDASFADAAGITRVPAHRSALLADAIERSLEADTPSKAFDVPSVEVMAAHTSALYTAPINSV